MAALRSSHAIIDGVVHVTAWIEKDGGKYAAQTVIGPSDDMVGSCHALALLVQQAAEPSSPRSWVR